MFKVLKRLTIGYGTHISACLDVLMPKAARSIKRHCAKKQFIAARQHGAI